MKPGESTVKHLLLLRHAKSDRNGALPDAERPLAPRGERAMAALGAWWDQEELHPDLVLCSTARRTRETLERLRPHLPDRVPVRFEEALYLAPAEALLERLRAIGDGVQMPLVVGHNPGLEDLARELAGHGAGGALERLENGLPTAALAELVVGGVRWSDLGPRAAHLTRVVRPKDLV